MKNISDIRVDIDNIDNELKTLFLKRMDCVEQVREYKAATNTPVKNKSREADIIKSKLIGTKKYVDETKEFFKSVIEISCNYQDKNLSALTYKRDIEYVDDNQFFESVDTVCHQGIVASYSHEVAEKYFNNKKIISVETFKDVFENVSNGVCDIGILPLENLCQGSVSDVFDLLNKYDVNITHNVDLSVKHCIAGVGSLCDVTSVVSHPQALGQCSKYIESNGFEKKDVINTAVAAKMVFENNDKSVAAICSLMAAKKMGLLIYDEDIANIKNNKTKFIFISKKPIKVNDADKVSIVFTIPHQSGTLSRILNNFANNDINMSKIESRPSDDGEWKYVFYVDIDLPEFDVIDYFSKIRYMFDDFKILGIHKTLE